MIITELLNNTHTHSARVKVCVLMGGRGWSLKTGNLETFKDHDQFDTVRRLGMNMKLKYRLCAVQSPCNANFNENPS